jgi:hypothetical protein
MVAMAAACKVSIALAVALAVIGAGARAHAQAIGPPPVFPVQISTTQPGATIVLKGPGGDIACGERCSLELPQSRYKMVLKDADGTLSTQKLFVEMPTSATVTPPSPGMRSIGITIMVVGLAGIVVGGFLFARVLGQKFVETIARDCAGPCMDEDVPTSTWIVAGASLGAGLALGATGLVIFRKNSHALVDISPLGPPRADTARLRLTPAAGPRWAGLGLTGGF